MGFWFTYGTKTTETIVVAEKERIMSYENSKYLIFTEEEVFENTDTIWHGKWNSSDVYRDLKEGEAYQIEVYGFRVPFLSMYRNIIRITP